MTATAMAEPMSLKLLEVRERAKRDPHKRFMSLAHLIDEAALKRAYDGVRKDAAVGVDGITKEQYGQDLDVKLRGLHQRLRSKTWRHQPIRRVHIPKEQGKTRPIGISSFEDKVVQGAVREVLEAVYEPVFLDVSFGFRRGRSAHDALRALNRVLHRGEVSWILEADIVSFFDSIDRRMLMEMLRERVADGSLLRLVGKCLHVGILDGEEYSEPEGGTVQGSSLSPLLGNVYLHHVLDLWFEREVLPRMRGKAHLVRYADDLVIGFEREDDAKRVMAVIGRRFKRFGPCLGRGHIVASSPSGSRYRRLTRFPSTRRALLDRGTKRYLLPSCQCRAYSWFSSHRLVPSRRPPPGLPLRPGPTWRSRGQRPPWTRSPLLPRRMFPRRPAPSDRATGTGGSFWWWMGRPSAPTSRAFRSAARC